MDHTMDLSGIWKESGDHLFHLCSPHGQTKYYSSMPEEGGATHVYRYHRGKSKLHMCSDTGNGQRKDRRKTSFGPRDIYQVSEHAPEASQTLGWHRVLLEFHHLFKQQEGPDPPANTVKTIAEILKHTHLAENVSKDLYIEVYPGTYSVTVGSNDLTKKTHVVAVDSGQTVDLVFPV
ncbi:hypothetical protein P7K49_022112 [Saguinus oedipus]|uniref:Uncharacterized protein n=1 Tax=Saguinus oedipus TaxID=9490 RepID=A0ABQ9UVE5_SAGOE|nr:hypothetical protein P7K49_022112 [Saguinus oedipus]